VRPTGPFSGYDWFLFSSGPWQRWVWKGSDQCYGIMSGSVWRTRKDTSPPPRQQGKGPWLGLINAKQEWKGIMKIVRTKKKAMACLWANAFDVTKLPKKELRVAAPWKIPQTQDISMSFLSFSCMKKINYFMIFFISTNDNLRTATDLLSR
jgi:hypothetical protein